MAVPEIELDFGDDDPLDGLAAGQPSATDRIITTVAGHPMSVQDATEKAFYEQLRDRYLEGYEFTDPSDIADLDRILTYELMSFRISQQLGRGYDANNLPLGSRDIASLQRTLRDTNTLLAKAKDDLGLSKAAREAGGDNDVAAYLMGLRKNALAMNLHRNQQVTLAMALMWEVCSASGTYLRSNDLERAKSSHRTADDVLHWIVDVVQPKWEEFDTHFRENGQNLWVGTV